MRWLILAQNRPAALHLLLESAHRFAHRVMPDVVLDWSSLDQTAIDGYHLLSSRFRVSWHPATRETWREEVLQQIAWPRDNGTLEPMTLVTSDTMFFSARANFQQAWALTLQYDLLGYSLIDQFTPGVPGMRDAVSRGLASSYYTWPWQTCQGSWGRAFRLGALYRPADLLGPLSAQKNWACERDLESLLCADASLRRRSKMACAEQATMLDRPSTDESANLRYLDGMCIDAAKFIADGSHYPWKKYG